MRMIIISEKRFDELLKETRNELSLTKFEGRTYMNPEAMIDSMHRSFNYHLCTFANKIRDE